MHVLRYSTMHAHDFFINPGNERHVIKAVEELLPERKFISSFDFVEETINSSDRLRLVISSQYDNLVRITYLKGK